MVNRGRLWVIRWAAMQIAKDEDMLAFLADGYESYILCSSTPVSGSCALHSAFDAFYRRFGRK